MRKTDYLLINISLIKLEMKTILWVCVFVALGVCAVIDPPVAAAGGQVALFLLRIIEKYKCLSFYKLVSRNLAPSAFGIFSASFLLSTPS